MRTEDLIKTLIDVTIDNTAAASSKQQAAVAQGAAGFGPAGFTSPPSSPAGAAAFLGPKYVGQNFTSSPNST